MSSYDNSWYQPGSTIKRLLWYFVNALFLKSHLNPSSAIKIFWLKSFGAKIGIGVVIKPGVNIKYPWNLSIGDHCWIGEEVWIDNLDQVTLEDHVCVSQGALLLCGNHDFKKQSFDLMTAPIVLREGSWVGAKSIVGPGVILESHAVLALGSVASSNLEAYGIFRGNPAVKIKERIVQD
ncbi:WcaF family extracellular polysaccharide biosynthesis acetyltransferase [Gelidibacter salicanalis]|uniref:WcaF family extracellular polysaccharide biosynthesis acetyltransferase n=1 Tax=Gelidibacter salicanalis TaxID=291193 RepID=UPI001FE6FF4E|nr:WcaF family extracellular polysaccharide biosynthesis acetyltransferase [Gelidibacter salicanalis]